MAYGSYVYSVKLMGSCLYFRKPSITALGFGVTRIPITFQEGRPGLTIKRLNCQPTGTHPSPRSAWVWRSASRSSSLLSTRRQPLCNSLIADGKYRATSLGRNTWKKLIGSQASLQTGCNKEGFNAASSRTYAKTRIGILGNDQRDCHTCDSKIGFGNGGQTDDSNTCGNNAIKGYTSDNGGRSIKAMGYILVQ